MSLAIKRADAIQPGDRIKVPAKDGGLGIVKQSGPCGPNNPGMRRIYALCPNSETAGAQVILISRPECLIDLVP